MFERRVVLLVDILEAERPYTIVPAILVLGAKCLIRQENHA